MLESIGELVRPAHVYFTIGPLQITESIVNMWITMAVLIVAGFLLTRRLSWLPTGVQNGVEFVVEGITGLLVFVMGEKWKWFVPYVGSLILFLFFANTTGIWTLNLLRPPTADLNTTLAMGLMTFALIHGFSIKENGLWNWFKGFFSPVFLFAPMNILGELAKPVSLGFRLFGNVFGGGVIMGMMYLALPFLAPVIGHFYFDLFSGILQTAVFAMLTMVFISMAAE